MLRQAIADLGKTIVEIRSIIAEEAQPLRAAILRPGLPFEESVYPQDKDPEAMHLGAYVDNELVTVASIFHEPLPGDANPKAWRLRGMVTMPELQRHGYGRAVLLKCIEHVARHGGSVLWCNARIDAVEFYRSLQFETIGEEEKTARGTSFIRMKRSVSPPDIQAGQE